MPPKKRFTFQQPSHAQRKRAARAAETEEQRQHRLQLQANRQAAARQNETPEQSQIRRRDNAARRLTQQTSEQRQTILQRERARQAEDCVPVMDVEASKKRAKVSCAALPGSGDASPGQSGKKAVTNNSDVRDQGDSLNGNTECAGSSGNPKSEPTQASALDSLSTCLACGKKDRAAEFILPGRYCSQSCADRNGCKTIICAAGGPSKVKSSTSGATPGKRKKKRASYLSAYEEDFRVDVIDDKKAVKFTVKKAKSFAWAKFLAEEKLNAAPLELFKDEPPLAFTNKFTVGMKLEGVDPQHPTLYCAITVVEIKGHRIRVHFDGYSECYDFWTYAHSDQIFPVGWCHENAKPLQAPKGMAKDSFNWEKYLTISKSVAAPHMLFTVCSKKFLSAKPAFNVGDKLEAVDVKNNYLVCVASVTDTYGDKLLVHFDGWEDTYDYWCTYKSLHIHPTGWCQENGQILSAPNGYVDPASFTWEGYLKTTSSRAAPKENFVIAEPLAFESGMALEVVDKRNPLLVRVTEILQVIDSRLLLHYSGWDNKYDYWEEANSPDLHPPGWCNRSGHPLQPPLSPLEIVNHSGACPTLGCHGYGHIKGSKYSGHHSSFGCPYSDINLSKDNVIIDRFLGQRKSDVVERPSQSTSPPATSQSQCSTAGCDGTGHVTGKFPTHFTISGCPLADVNQNKLMKNLSIDTSQATSALKKDRRRRSSSLRGPVAIKRPRSSPTHPDTPTLHSPQPTVAKFTAVDRQQIVQSTASTMQPPPRPDKVVAQALLQSGVHRSVFLPAIPHSHRQQSLPICWDKNIRLLPGISGIPFSTVPSWNAGQVVDFIKSVVPTLTTDQKNKFVDQEIDGAAFLLLTQSDITSILKLKLGPALKVYNSVVVIKKGLDKSSRKLI